MTPLLVERFYGWLHSKSSPSGERGEYSAGFWQNKIRENAVALASSYSGRVLEAGCGEGLFLEGLRKANPKLELYGVDSWPDILSKAQKRLADYGVRLEEGDVFKLPFFDAYFDAVVCINVFINLNFKNSHGIDAAIAELARVCKPGGHIILEFRNALNILVSLKFKLAKYYDVTIRDRQLPLNTFLERDMRAIFKRFHCDIGRTRHLDFPVKALAPIIILEVQKNEHQK